MFAGGVERQRESGGAVGVAVAGAGGGVFDNALGRDDAVEAGDVVTQALVGRDADGAGLEVLLHAGE